WHAVRSRGDRRGGVAKTSRGAAGERRGDGDWGGYSSGVRPPGGSGIDRGGDHQYLPDRRAESDAGGGHEGAGSRVFEGSGRLIAYFAQNVVRSHDRAVFAVEVRERHGVDLVGGTPSAAPVAAGEGEDRILHRQDVEPKIPGHPHRGFDGIIGNYSDHD